MIEKSHRPHLCYSIVLAATLTVAGSCGRSSLFAPATRSAGNDGGKVADLGGPDRPNDGRDGAPDAGPDGPADAGPDGPADASPDRASDRVAERVIDTALRGDLAAADSRPDAPGRDRPPSTAEAGTLELVAGRLGSHGAHDGIGPLARFGSPAGMTTDGMGNLFLADMGNHAIRKIVLATGEVTTLAGTTTIAGSEDGIGSAASFCVPEDVAYDGAGSLFVADMGNGIIRRVVIATGAVTTVAGSRVARGSADGKGAEASFVAPMAVAYDGAGNLFIADAGSYTLRKLVIATGEVTTLAGAAGELGYADGIGAAARFSSPWHLALDKAGNLFVADNNTVRQVVTATGAVSTLAGNTDVWSAADGTGGLASFGRLTGVAWDGAGNVLVADSTSSDSLSIRQVVIATGEVRTIVTQADAAATCPWLFTSDGYGPGASPSLNVASDGAGNLYVSVAYNEIICKVALATKTVSALAGAAAVVARADGVGGEARFDTPRGLASDGSGTLFAVDHRSVRRIDIATSKVTTLAERPWGRYSGGGFDSEVVSDRAGNVFFADSGAIHKITLATGANTILAGSPDKYGQKDGTGAAASFATGAVSLAYDVAGALFVAVQGSPSIRRVEIPTGAVTTLALSAPGSGDQEAALGAPLGNPAGLACDGEGRLFVADAEKCVLHQVDLVTGIAAILAGSPGACGFADGTGPAARFRGPANLTSDGAGNLYVSDPLAHAVRKVDVVTREVTTVVGTPDPFDIVILGRLPAHLNYPAGLAYVPGTGLFIADAEESAILLARF